MGREFTLNSDSKDNVSTHKLSVKTVLTGFLFRLPQLPEQVDATSVAVSSEAMNSRVEECDYIKMAAQTEPGLKSSIEQTGVQSKPSNADRHKQQQVTRQISEWKQVEALIHKPLIRVNESLTVVIQFVYADQCVPDTRE